MDQEKFDHHLMDYLFDELDEVTRAAMKRKIEADAHCREIEARMRATIEVGQLPLEEPSDDLEERIVEACDAAHKGEPWRAKVVRMLSWAGSKAMDPRLAMAAILVLVVGSAILLLPAKPGSVAVTPTKEPSGTPAEPAGDADGEDTEAQLLAEAERAEAAAEPAASAPPEEKGQAQPVDVAALDERFDRGLKNMQSGNFGDAQRDFSVVNQAPAHPKAASASLYEARAVRSKDGCKDAVTYYDRARRHDTVANEAAWEQADCYAHLGNMTEARKIWLALSDEEEYAQRATVELQSRGQVGSSGKHAVAAPKRAAARPPPAASPPAGGSGKNAKSAADDAYESPAPPEQQQSY
jgi:hypothetical protein